jgi:hypothetical protein
VHPATTQISVNAVPGTQDISISTNQFGTPAIPNGIISVEFPQGVPVPPANTSPQRPAVSIYDITNSQSIWYYDQVYEFREDFSGQYLHFRYAFPTLAPGSNYNVYIKYFYYYAPLGQDSDVLTIPAQDEAALIWFVCGRAYRWLDQQRMKRGYYVPDAPAGGGQRASAGLNNLSAATQYEQRYASLASTRWQARGIRSSYLQPER